MKVSFSNESEKVSTTTEKSLKVASEKPNLYFWLVVALAFHF